MWNPCETPVNMPISHVLLELPMWKDVWNTCIFTCEISHVKFHMLNFTCENSRVNHMWNFTCEISHVNHMCNFTCEISHVKFHMWNFTCKTSHVKFHMWNFTCESPHVIHTWKFTCEISYVKIHVKFHMWISHVKFHMWNFACEISSPEGERMQTLQSCWLQTLARERYSSSPPQ